MRYVGTARHEMARRALASAAQLRELDGAWEKVSTELGDAVTFALSQRAKDPLRYLLAAIHSDLPGAVLYRWIAVA